MNCSIFVNNSDSFFVEVSKREKGISGLNGGVEMEEGLEWVRQTCLIPAFSEGGELELLQLQQERLLQRILDGRF